jgi:GntR family transcriptional regulator
MIVKRNKGPMYLQIKEVLKDRILNGEFALHTNIPSEPQLEEEFNVSKRSEMQLKNLFKKAISKRKVGKERKSLQMSRLQSFRRESTLQSY